MAKNISFVNSINPSFAKELKGEVDAYFKNTNKKQTGDWRIYHKTIVLLSSLVVIYFVLLFGSLPAWVNIILCALLGFNFSLIGFNVMHDGAHGSYSENKRLNNLMGYSLNVMGGSTYFWKVKHNVIHHTYTNIDGHDEDIDIKPFIRTSKEQKGYWFHKFQHIYSVFLYSLTYVFWIGYNDFHKYFTGKILDKKIPEMSLQNHIGFWLTKIGHFSIFIVLPIVVAGWQHALIGYVIASAVCGILISVVFQLAHVVENVDFPVPDGESHKIEQNWFIHQIQTTANFSTRSKIVSWMTGGLNFQVEHHLFPKISHIHYPEINKIVQKVCAKYAVPYNEYRTLGKAFISHLSYLKQIGQMA